MAAYLKRGVATANTNRGHDGGGPWKLSDMNNVPYHLMVAESKAIVSAYYGNPASFTVMNECGGGGSRDALMEVQSWPNDVDAAAASGIVYYATHHGIAHMWVWQATHKTEASDIPPSKYPVIHQGALNACDANDGLRDGVITDPEHCKFDPGVLLCKNGDAPDCLTAPQVEAARTIYAGAGAYANEAENLRVDAARRRAGMGSDGRPRAVSVRARFLSADGVRPELGLQNASSQLRHRRRQGGCAGSSRHQCEQSRRERIHRPRRQADDHRRLERPHARARAATSTTTGAWSPRSARERREIRSGSSWCPEWITASARITPPRPR